MNRVIIVAEAGVNHNGNIELAKELIRAAAQVGADYCKFQTFVPDLNISENAPRADYQIRNTGTEESQLEMVRKLALSRNDHLELVRCCKEAGIGFLSTAFDIPSVDLLSELDMTLWKVPSGEITNRPLLKKIASQRRPILLSTGMSNIGEVEAALEILLTDSGLSRSDITILHCNTEYPSPLVDINLRAMLTLGQAFKTGIGYSDHTLGIEIPIAAVALGATVIEKHFTLDRSLPGPDHMASLEPDQFADMVSSIRNIESALGDGIKHPSPSERKNILIARKSLHTSKDLCAGHILTEADIIAKRPGDGISPMLTESIIGARLRSSLPKDHKLSITDIELV